MTKYTLTRLDYSRLIELVATEQTALDHRAFKLRGKVEGVDFMPGLREQLKTAATELRDLNEKLTILRVNAPIHRPSALRTERPGEGWYDGTQDR